MTKIPIHGVGKEAEAQVLHASTTKKDAAHTVASASSHMTYSRGNLKAREETGVAGVGYAWTSKKEIVLTVAGALSHTLCQLGRGVLISYAWTSKRGIVLTGTNALFHILLTRRIQPEPRLAVVFGE